jgi:hypothetical protein
MVISGHLKAWCQLVRENASWEVGTPVGNRFGNRGLEDAGDVAYPTCQSSFSS